MTKLILGESSRLITANFEIDKLVYGYDWSILGGNPVEINGIEYPAGFGRSSFITNSCEEVLRMKIAFVFNPDAPSSVVLNCFVHE
jgi:hypothetical protein